MVNESSILQPWLIYFDFEVPWLPWYTICRGERRIRHLLQGLRNQQWSKPWQQLQNGSVLRFFELQLAETAQWEWALGATKGSKLGAQELFQDVKVYPCVSIFSNMRAESINQYSTNLGSDIHDFWWGDLDEILPKKSHGDHRSHPCLPRQNELWPESFTWISNLLPQASKGARAA